jgi:feruloyl esterase
VERNGYANKVIIEAFYAAPPSYSYWNGCSFGGWQGLMEGRRYPQDYDGILAGSPGSSLDPEGWATLNLWWAKASEDPSSAIPSSKLPIIHEAVLRACDGLDGLTDRLIDDPRRCRFDPNVLACKSVDNEACLTVAQTETVRKILSPVSNPRTAAEIVPRVEPGSELEWSRFAAGQQPSARDANAFRHVFLKKPDWDWREIDFDRDINRAKAAVDALGFGTPEPDLRAFAGRGGKLLMYYGWSDINPPQATVNYYTKVLGEAATAASVRLFLAPGMTHCGYGDGPNTFDGMGALEEWVERGIAPARIIASHSPDYPPTIVDRTRPLCPYPQVAR